MSVAAQSSSRWFVFFLDSSASAKMKFESSKAVRELKGNQSAVDCTVGDIGGASEVRNSPCSLHRLAAGKEIERQRGKGNLKRVCVPVRNG